MTQAFTVHTVHTNKAGANFKRLATYGNGNTLYFSNARAAVSYVTDTLKSGNFHVTPCELPATQTFYK